MIAARGRVGILRGIYWGVVAWLFLPLALMALVSVSDAETVGFPIGHPTWRWYGALLDDTESQQAFLYSCALAVGSTSLALAMGTWIALAITALRRPVARAALFACACLPIVTPGIVSAISLRMFIRLLGLDPGPAAIALGHAVHAVPFVVIMLTVRLRMMPADLVEVARILGATPARAFCRVTLPWLAPAVAGATVLALLESFDDFLRSFFLGGYQPTLPVLIYGRLFSGLSPEVNAIATIVLVLTVSVGVAGERLWGRRLTPPSRDG